MTNPSPVASRAVPGPRTTLLLVAMLLAAGAVTGLELHAMRRQVEHLSQAQQETTRQLEVLAGEVTRYRIEQRAEGKGPQALLEQLNVYAPMLETARTTAPDYRAADEQMKSIMRAFKSLGSDAFPAVRHRFDELDPKQSYAEMKHLLEALLACSPDDGKQIVAAVLSGQKKPSPRLRWWAADLLLQTDRELAQGLLRRILLTESSRGIDPDRAVAQGVSMIDPAAVAVTGFSNFVGLYLRSEDPKAEDTLLQVLQQTYQDPVTIQEAVEALGSLHSKRATQRIEELFQHPPGASQNALFLNKCLSALVDIEGPGARPFLEAQLPLAEHELVQDHIKFLLGKLQ